MPYLSHQQVRFANRRVDVIGLAGLGVLARCEAERLLGPWAGSVGLGSEVGWAWDCCWDSRQPSGIVSVGLGCRSIGAGLGTAETQGPGNKKLVPHEPRTDLIATDVPSHNSLSL